jgi:hypothetical protein
MLKNVGVGADGHLTCRLEGCGELVRELASEFDVYRVPAMR